MDQPVSIQALLRTQREEREAKARVRDRDRDRDTVSYSLTSIQPRFLSREDRAALAIASRAQEIRQQREREDLVRRDREALERQADEIRNADRARHPVRRQSLPLFSFLFPLLIPLQTMNGMPIQSATGPVVSKTPATSEPRLALASRMFPLPPVQTATSLVPVRPRPCHHPRRPLLPPTLLPKTPTPLP